MDDNFPLLLSCKTLKPEYKLLHEIPLSASEISIGRGLNNTVIIPFLSISRNHCIIKKVNDNWVLLDNSAFGIKVNGISFRKGANVELKHEDVIVLEPSEEFVYKFTNPSEDFGIPRKRLKLEHKDNENILHDVKLKFEQSQCYEIKCIEEKIQNAKIRQESSKIMKDKLQSDMNKKIEWVNNEYASQIKKLRGEEHDIEEQKTILIAERDAQLVVVRKEMEEQITDLMNQIQKHNETESKLLQENTNLKERLEKDKNEFLEEIKKESLSKQDLLDKLNAKLRAQEEARLKEKEEMEQKLIYQTAILKLDKEKELKQLKEAKLQREKELEEQLNKIKKDLEQQAQKAAVAEQVLNEERKKLTDEEKTKTEQLHKEKDEIQKKLKEAEENSDKAIEQLKELKQLEEAKIQREKELEEQLSKIKRDLEQQVQKAAQAEQVLNEERQKLTEEEKAKIEQLRKEKEEVQKKLKEAQENSNKTVEQLKKHVQIRETELATLAADRIQQQAEQSSRVISSLQEQLESVKNQLKSVETEKNTLLEKHIMVTDDTAKESSSKETTLAEVGELMESELQCSICAELFVAATTLNCSHTFCKYCITKWKKKKKDCPICRTPISSECKSIVLDSFIEKMVQNLTEDMKRKRLELLKAREELESKQAGQLNVETNRRSLSYDESDSDSDSEFFEEGEEEELYEDDYDTYWPFHSSRYYDYSSDSNGGSDEVASDADELAGTATGHIAANAAASAGAAPRQTAGAAVSDSTNGRSNTNGSSRRRGNVSGLPGAYYGGYGRCYNCGARGHWAPGCPNR